MLRIDLHVLDDGGGGMRRRMMTAWIEIWNGDVMIGVMKHYYYYYRGRWVEVVVESRCC